jgi:phage terminase Nu1 subunit (DNA packaging protein)
MEGYELGAGAAPAYKLVSAGYVANVAATSTKTVQRWAEDGLLQSYDRVNGDMWVFDKAYIDEIAEQLRAGKKALQSLQGAGEQGAPDTAEPEAVAVASTDAGQ